MKKFFLFIFILILVALFCLNSTNAFERISFQSVPSFFYNKYALSNTCILKKSTTYSFAGSKDDIMLLIDSLSITIIDTQYIDSVMIVYGYSPRLGECITYKGNKYNVQIAYNAGTISIGLPIILSGY